MFNIFEYYLSKLIKKFHLKAIKKSNIHKTSGVCAGCHIVESEMDRYSDIGYDCTVVKTKIGSFVSIGSNCRIGGADHTTSWVSTSPVFNENKDHLSKKFSRHQFKNTAIGHDVWIGDCVLIKAGVEIGHGSVIGMGSVVKKNVPPYEIWAGNPAKFIKKRFDDEIIKSLLNVKWWDFSETKISEKALLFNDVERFIKAEH